MLPLSDRERAISALQMWGELPRKRGSIEDFWKLTDEAEEDWFLLPENDEEEDAE